VSTSEFEYRETVEDLFQFVSDVVLPSMVDYERYGYFRFRINHSEKYDASVQPIGNRFRIELNTGLVLALVRFIEHDLASEKSVLKKHISEIEDTFLTADTKLNLVLASSIVFVLLHEVYHVIAGHSECHSQLQMSAGMSDTSLSESSSTQSENTDLPAYFFELIELEADGGAYSTTLEFSRQIFASVTDSHEPQEEDNAWIERSVILGCLSALAVLQEISPITSDQTGGTRFPDVRIMNICSANYRTMATPAYEKGGDEPYTPLDLDRKTAESVASRYESTIFPAIVMLDTMLTNQFGTSRFLKQNIPSTKLFDTPYMQDIRSVLSGLVPRLTPAGRQLTNYVAHRLEFMQYLDPFRRANLW